MMLGNKITKAGTPIRNTAIEMRMNCASKSVKPSYVSVDPERDARINRVTARQLERTHMQGKLYVACDDLNFDWYVQDVATFDHMWVEGLSVDSIAEAFKRPVDEIAILVLDRARKGGIDIRAGGANGY